MPRSGREPRRRSDRRNPGRSIAAVPRIAIVGEGQHRLDVGGRAQPAAGLDHDVRRLGAGGGHDRRQLVELGRAARAGTGEVDDVQPRQPAVTKRRASDAASASAGTRRS